MPRPQTPSRRGANAAQSFGLCRFHSHANYRASRCCRTDLQARHCRRTDQLGKGEIRRPLIPSDEALLAHDPLKQGTATTCVCTCVHAQRHNMWKCVNLYTCEYVNVDVRISPCCVGSGIRTLSRENFEIKNSGLKPKPMLILSIYTILFGRFQLTIKNVCMTIFSQQFFLTW